MKKHLTLALSILWLLSAEVQAQALLQPLQQEQPVPQRSKQAYQQLRAAALSLPFFDDFASGEILDDTRWQGSGVYLNDRYALRPITKNVVSLDGLNSLGQPYSASTSVPGPSDTLTSAPLQLSSLVPADSVYLSFYWQSGGLGDTPDLTENNQRYLVLEFFDNSGAWQEVWRQPAVGTVTDFAQVFVGLRESRYFHSDFRFRFRNVGQRNGMLDVWNLDYVELYKNRRKGQSTTRDVAISQPVSRLLQHYTAMPSRQFILAPEAALAPEVSATLNNLSGLPAAITWRGYLKKLSEATADTFLRGEALITGNARQYTISGVPSLSGINLPQSGYFALQHGILLDTEELSQQQRANDSTQRTTQFRDYFAYDDGSAEASYSFVTTTGNTQVAQRYDLVQADQLSAFRVYFPRVGRDISNTSITFRVWKDEGGVPGEVLYSQNFTVQYTDSLNKFYEVQLERPLPLNGTFYIGWSQVGTLYVNLGFDRNEQANDRRFTYTAATGWQPENRFAGALMLRPVLVGEALSVDDELYKQAMKIYPNPSSGTVYLSEPYEQVQVYDLTGRLVLQAGYKGARQPLQLGHLSPGVYTLRIFNRETVISKKLILTKP